MSHAEEDRNLRLLRLALREDAYRLHRVNEADLTPGRSVGRLYLNALMAEETCRSRGFVQMRRAGEKKTGWDGGAFQWGMVEMHTKNGGLRMGVQIFICRTC